MKKEQKLLISIVLSLFIVFSAGTFGFYNIEATTMEEDQRIINNFQRLIVRLQRMLVELRGMPTETPLETPTETVALFIDSETYSYLTDEIDTFQNDIKNDLDVDVFIHNRDFESADEVRDIIIDHFNNDNLIGSILIGDIPAARFGELVGSRNYPSDYYYMDLDDHYHDTNDDGIIDSRPRGQTVESLPEVWSGRLTPPVGGPEGISLLKDYFERNHLYRTGQISSNEKALFIRDPYLHFHFSRDEVDIISQSENEEQAAEYLKWIYEEGDIDTIHSLDSEEFVEKMITALSYPHEFATISVHGTALRQFFHETIVTGADIKELDNDPFFYFISSCSNGDFTEENYAAGWYLFSGNTLAVDALTHPSFHGDDVLRQKYPLNFGVALGEARLNAGSSNIGVLLGDPTLRMRRELLETGASTPQDLFEIEFSDVPVGQKAEEQKIVIENDGEEPLELVSGPRAYSKNGDYGGAKNIGAVEWPYFTTIEPSGHKEIYFHFRPGSVGNYEVRALYYTNDLSNPLVRINVSGSGYQAVPPSVSLISPNGGEEWEIGENYKIEWESKGVGVITFGLHDGRNEEDCWVFREVTSYDGENNYVDELNTMICVSDTGEEERVDIRPGDQYKVWIEVSGDPETRVYSDDYFSIIGEDALICEQPTVNFDSGCNLLLHYDKDNDGIISETEALSASLDHFIGKITEEERNFVRAVFQEKDGKINAMCTECWTPEGYTLSVRSSPITGIPVDSRTDHDGITNYTIRDIEDGTSIFLIAPEAHRGYEFEKWSGCDSARDTVCRLTLNSDRRVNAHYTEEEKEITLISPNGGEIWQMGDTHRIVWSSELVRRVDIEIAFGSDSGQRTTIAEEVVARDGVYQWTVPSDNPNTPPGDFYKIVITDSFDPSVSDISENFFKILRKKTAEECSTDRDCRWCGYTCIPRDKDIECIQVVPPEGSKCVCKEGKCTAILADSPPKYDLRGLIERLGAWLYRSWRE